ISGRVGAWVMRVRKSGKMIFTGACASLRGRAHFAAFSGAKFAMSDLSKIMARELLPKGIHFAHPIIVGAIDSDFIRET
ncbi:SDR family NAD(P)-dependent oxidoreductase, partial [Pseudomonas aeruginosa]